MGFVDDTGSHNGNPPALINCGGELYAAYGNRDHGEMRAALWSSSQNKWITFQLRARENDQSVDIGYPQLFLAKSGKVCVYYWTSEERPQQHIAWTKF